MKKTMVYAATAILLGFAIMMVPFVLRTGPLTFERGAQPNTYLDEPKQGFAEGQDTVSGFSRIGAQPSNLLPSSFVLFSGLIAALGAYVILKRRMI